MSELYTANVTLGYKDSSANQDSALGDEFDAIVAELDSGDDVFVNTNAARLRCMWLEKVDAGTMAAGTIAKRDAANDMAVNATAAGAGDVGVCVVDPYITSAVAQNEKFIGVVRGRVKVLSGAAITKGDTLKADASGKAITNSISLVADVVSNFGVALEAASGADELIWAYVDFQPLG